MHASIRNDQILAIQRAWPNDRYEVRNVNGADEQHWAVCDTALLNICSLSYTEEEAIAICQRFNRKR